MRRAVLVLGLGLASCAPAPYGSWADNSADPTCRFEAISRAGGYDNSYRTVVGSAMDMDMRRQEIYTACMQAKPEQPPAIDVRARKCLHEDGTILNVPPSFCIPAIGKLIE